jgi:pantothenate kinase-related protein Tda10
MKLMTPTGITVTVTGRNSVGKTTVAEVIYRALRDQGLDVGLTTDTGLDYLMKHSADKLGVLRSRRTLVRIIDGEDQPGLRNHLLNEIAFLDPPVKTEP